LTPGASLSVPIYYLETNPDVRAAGADPALHYLLHGGLEGRAPGPFFSTVAYLARYPAVAEAGLNALVHYETYGRLEKRNLLGEPILL
jgi:O-antigen biosynthesis protein